jgi:YHS domain-containing protein
MKTALLVTLVGFVLAACGAPSEPAADAPSGAALATSSPAVKQAAPAAAAPAMHDMQAQEAPARPAEATTFTRVEPSKVCMVNNHYMGREQIPVVVQGKTYFGCCQMCEAKLAKEPSARTAQDPISGKTVDKATAVIGSDPGGAVQYFENQANFETYASR